MLKREPIGALYSLERLEVMVLRDIACLKQQLSRLEASDDGMSDARQATAVTYREMISLRQQLLAEIREKSVAFGRDYQVDIAAK